MSPPLISGSGAGGMGIASQDALEQLSALIDQLDAKLKHTFQVRGLLELWYEWKNGVLKQPLKYH